MSSGFIFFLILGAVALFAFKPILRGFKAGLKGESGDKICPACGTIGYGTKVTRGSFGIELLLWLCFIVPGLIYSFWRMSTTTWNTCPGCNQGGMIPLNSPRGKQLAAEFAPHQAK